MPTIPRLLTQAEQQVQYERRTFPVVDVSTEFATPFGTFIVRRQDTTYLLCYLDSPAARLLTGDNSVMGLDVPITAVDDADALRQAILLVWGRVNAGVKELDAMVRAVGAVAETRTKVGV